MKTGKTEVIGVLGGCGPHAGLVLVDQIFRHTKANADQEHLPLLLSSIPGKITDRTAFILGQTTQNPAKAIAGLILQLESAGATVIGIACNTAHSPVIFDSIIEILLTRKSKVKLLHIVKETVSFLRNNFRHIKKVGVLCTEGAYKTKLYETELKNNGLNVINPGEHFQRNYIHRCVYDPEFGIKACSAPVRPEAKELLRKIVAYYKAEGADALILGCTEFSIALTAEVIDDIPIIDSTKVLARALVREACVEKLVDYQFNTDNVFAQ